MVSEDSHGRGRGPFLLVFRTAHIVTAHSYLAGSGRTSSGGYTGFSSI